VSPRVLGGTIDDVGVGRQTYRRVTEQQRNMADR
jgi:hypothetical protein